ncbi:MAG: hypothetical protein BWY50_02071 [Spirochaetes bacterium ADurb.Bin315]|nr:MAG: hypothetical protein BWY50_02071 [Spirochaetes bacterium ADurb.Bin315]
MKNLLQCIDRRGGNDADPRFDPMFLDEVQRAVEMDVAFIMDSEIITAGGSEICDIAFRPLNHQMRVEGKVAMLSQALNDDRSKADIRHEDAVHHIKVNPVRPMVLNRSHLGRAL